MSINRLQFDTMAKSEPTLDILLKKFKQRFVDNIDDATADALGLSRAILCNDVLAKLQQRLDTNQQFYKALIRKAEEMAKCYTALGQVQATMGGIFAEIGTKETSNEGRKSFGQLGTTHNHIGKEHAAMAIRYEQTVKELRCHAEAAIPDVRQTLAKYLDAKYEYLAYCLRVKELEDEEAEFGVAGERLARMAGGNYEYRAMLKCRESSRAAFIEKRKQVAVKIELLDERHGCVKVGQISIILAIFSARVGTSPKNPYGWNEGNAWEMP